MDDNLDVLGRLRKYEHMDTLKKKAADEIESLRARIEELETANSTLDIAVNHWQHNYKQLDLLYSQLAGRG
jgi:FtsZ-binding cell division protein ZapB